MLIVPVTRAATTAAESTAGSATSPKAPGLARADGVLGTTVTVTAASGVLPGGVVVGVVVRGVLGAERNINVGASVGSDNNLIFSFGFRGWVDGCRGWQLPG